MANNSENLGKGLFGPSTWFPPHLRARQSTLEYLSVLVEAIPAYTCAFPVAAVLCGQPSIFLRGFLLSLVTSQVQTNLGFFHT